MSDLRECTSAERVGLICKHDTHLVDRELIGDAAYGIQDVSGAIDATEGIAAVVSFGTASVGTTKPQLHHITSTQAVVAFKNDQAPKSFNYPGAGDFFVIPSHKHFRSAPAAVAHSRTLTFLKSIVGGPYFDLEAIWEEHTKFEFAERAVEKTMGTMVQEPYVNHVPTMTGGIGRERLTNFYRHHFIFNNPADTAMELVSRTVGIDRVIDEFIFSFTHDKVIDWM